MSKVKNPTLAKSGKLKLEWAMREMPVLSQIKADFKKSKPFRNLKIAACLHVTKETAILVKTLVAGGARVFLAGSNPLTTQDDVAAALANGIAQVYAWRGQTNKEYYW
jgi:adenosylhomocysteinase